MRQHLFVLLIVALAPRFGVAQSSPALPPSCLSAADHQLPQPGAVPSAQFVAFEQQVLRFLQSGEYKRLNWCMDKGVRDTGPFRQGVYYGTHLAVRVHYSPAVMRWLIGGRQGSLPDGAMIIKEHYPPPAARYAGLSDGELPRATDWTVVIKDSRGSKDGWFWGEFFEGMTFDDNEPPFRYPWASFGQYCVNCHSTAEREYTFSSTRNIQGFPGQPLRFADDGTWRGTPALLTRHRERPSAVQSRPALPNADLLRTFSGIARVLPADVQAMLPETYDHVAAPASGPGRFLGSSQCQSCHSALTGPFGPTMFLPAAGSAPGAATGADVSPYGEWRWSPMGLAGRDPIFYAQLDSELAYARSLPPAQGEPLAAGLRNACFSCHGVMGQRQHALDTGGADFSPDVLRITDRQDPQFLYGALARDGVSCTVCHRIVERETPSGVAPLQHFLQNFTTGQFAVGPPDRLYGPFANDTIAPSAMQNALGTRPRHGEAITTSRLCGTCHTIDLPVADGKMALHSIEQSTYLEWLNSAYQTEFGAGGAQAQSCQGCHMPRSYRDETRGIRVDALTQKIAAIQDETYPQAENQIPARRRTVEAKEGFARHTLLGLNVFLLEMFNQFAEVLGVRKDDFMSGSTTGLADTIRHYAEQARQQTAGLAVSARRTGQQQVTAEVTVTNRTGHRFPSGVGFRRAFLEFLVVQNDSGRERVVWSSGRTNSVGVVVDAAGQPLPSEFFSDVRDAQGQTRQAYQPHHRLITSPGQVQIYEELVQDANGRFTTSFIRRDETVKDNRLLPLGWSRTGPDPSLNGRYLRATLPDGEAAADPDFLDGQGRDRLTYQVTLPSDVDPTRCTVRVALYYQSIPPSYLRDRFNSAPDEPATRRLHYLTSHLDLSGTPAENWKLPIASATAGVTP